MPEEEVLTSGVAETDRSDEGIFTIKVNGENIPRTCRSRTTRSRSNCFLEALVKYHIVETLDEISAAGHRIVQGGAYFDQSVKVDADVVNKVEELAPLAPLHNPAHLICYRAFCEALPKIGHVFVLIRRSIRR